MHSQQVSGDRTLVMGPKRDGPNWVMIAGGAIVMAVGIVIGRKQIQCQRDQFRGRSSNLLKAEISTFVDPKVTSSKGTPGSRGVDYEFDAPRVKELFDDNFSPDGTGSKLSWKAPRVMAHWDGSGTPASFQPQVDFYSSKPKRTLPNKSSLPAFKMCRQMKDETSSGEEPPSDTYSSSALRAGLASKREMVIRLRKQLRSRDTIIFDLQGQISDQDQVIAMHRAQTADLQERLDSTNTEIFNTNLEMQRLRKEMRMIVAKPVFDIEDLNESDISDHKKQLTNTNLKAVLLETNMLKEKIIRLQIKKQDLKSQVQAFSRECELLFRKVSALDAEREELKKLINEKGLMLEAKEQEWIELTAAFVNLQRNSHPENRDSDWTRISDVSRASDTRSENSRGTWSDAFDQPVSCNTSDDYCPRSPNIIDSDNQLAGDCVRSYNTLFRQSPSPLHSDGSVSKPGSRTNLTGCTCKSMCDGSPNYDGPDCDNDETPSLSLVWTLQQEVYQLSDALASKSKAVSQKKLETSRVLTEFQATQATSISRPDEYDWEYLSQVLCFSPDGTSTEQLQGLSHKLEKVAKQQQVEDELEALARHQSKIRALRSRLSKLNAKSNAKMDESSNESALRVAWMISDVAERLNVQEERVRETSMDIQQLSMSLQLSSPYVPRSKKQELRRMLQGCGKHADGSIRNCVVHKDIPVSPGPSADSSYVAPEPKSDNYSSRFFDRQISFSSLPHKEDALMLSPEKLPDKVYEFQVGAFDPLPTIKTRKSGNLGAANSSLRKSAIHQGPGTGLKWDAGMEKPIVQKSTRRVCFSPEEVTGGFSFRPSASKALLSPDSVRRTNFEADDSVTNSEHFQFRPEIHEASDQETSTEVGAQHDYSSSCTHASSHSQPTISWSASVGPENRDNLRRLFFKPENSSHTGNSSNTVPDRKKDAANELGDSYNTERDYGYVTDDGNIEVQTKRPTDEDSPSVLVASSNSAMLKQDMHSGPGPVGMSPFAARMACFDMKRSSSSLTASQGNEGANQGVSLPSRDEDADDLASYIDLKLNVGKENLRSNGLFQFGSQSVSRMISSKDNWEESQAMSGKDIFRCDRRRWNSSQDSCR